MAPERYGLLRPRIGLQWLCGFGTKKRLKKPSDFKLAQFWNWLNYIFVHKLM